MPKQAMQPTASRFAIYLCVFAIDGFAIIHAFPGLAVTDLVIR